MTIKIIRRVVCANCDEDTEIKEVELNGALVFLCSTCIREKEREIEKEKICQSSPA